MYKVAVVILNYMNYQETITCVDSVLLQKNIEFEVIVVDNGSTNESFRVLCKKYHCDSIVHVLRAKKNYGFAKGNNIGIRYAKEKLQADFILLINSDTVMIDENYIGIMVSKYDKTVGVIGSEIILRNGKKQKPYAEYTRFPGTLIYYIGILNQASGVSSFGNFFERLLKKYERTVILHGSAFMLTPSYLGKYGGLYDKTFLYTEEILLYILCKRADLKQVYIADTQIYHKEDQSSKYLYKNKSSIKTKYFLKSYKYVVKESYIDYLREKSLNLKVQLRNVKR